VSLRQWVERDFILDLTAASVFGLSVREREQMRILVDRPRQIKSMFTQTFDYFFPLKS